jgi:hypothetical protein
MRVLYFKNNKLAFTSVTLVAYQMQISSPETAISTLSKSSKVATPFTHLKVVAPVKNKNLSIK